MRVTLPIFERRMASGVTCVTLGLGPDTKRREGKNPRKAEAKILEDLQTFLRKTPASRLAQLEPVAGTKLPRLRLQLNLTGAERRKIAGRYPFILEPRWTTATDKRLFDRPAMGDALVSLLARDHVASVVVVGPAQAGKTTLIHQLVGELLCMDGYETHHDLDRVRHVWRISGRRLIAGMSRMGEWEKRCVDLIEDARGQLRLDRQVLREAQALAVNWLLLPRIELPRAALVDRLDMSEYMLPGSGSRLLDASPARDSLARRVRRQPLCLVLFDEIEKAHPEVFDLLLSVLGEGRLTDEDGRVVDFRMSLIVMTSNLGASSTQPVGFGDGAPSPDREAQRAARAYFRPEFTNRIDHVIGFRSLDRTDVQKIVDLELEKVRARPGIARRGISLRVTAQARERLADLGFDPHRGARGRKRVIEVRVVAPLAVWMAANPTMVRGVVRVEVDGTGEILVETSN